MTENEIRTLTRKANKGDAQAFQKLYQENAKLAKRANTRLSTLEKSNYDFYAYDRAVGFTQTTYNKNRFTTSKKVLEDVEGIAWQVRELNRFLSAKSSTVRGQKQIELGRVEKFREMGVNVPQGKEKDFLRYLGTETIQEVFEVTGRSEDIVDLIKGMQHGQRSFNKLNRMFNAFLDDKIAYDELEEQLKAEQKREQKRK